MPSLGQDITLSAAKLLNPRSSAIVDGIISTEKVTDMVWYDV